MKRIIWKRPDGGVSITIPCEQMVETETEQEYLDRIEHKLREKHIDANGNLSPAVPDDWVRVADLPEENCPNDRTFRNAWTWTTPDPVIDIDFDKAKEITKDRLRTERKPLLEALDIETMRNITDTTKLVEIEAKKQVLRDVTKKVDVCKTLDELKAVKVYESSKTDFNRQDTLQEPS